MREKATEHTFDSQGTWPEGTHVPRLEMGPKSRRLLLVAAALTAACGSAAGSGRAMGSWVVATSSYSATLHFDRGRQSLSFRLAEPPGTIRLYRLVAPGGARIRASAQLPRITVPLRIATPRSSCTKLGTRVSCTVAEDGCPMPKGAWRFRVEKLAGPPGAVTLTFRIGGAAA
jgi:hypothetical protein